MSVIKEYGPEIKVDRRRPDWLGGYRGPLGYLRSSGNWYGPSRYWTEADIINNDDGWSSVEAIRLPATHFYYAPKPAQEPVQGQTAREVDADTLKRLIALCGAFSADDIPCGEYLKLKEEARAIQALLEPVETEKERVTRLLMDCWYKDGRFDEVVKFVLDQLEHGRTLERQAIEKGL